MRLANALTTMIGIYIIASIMTTIVLIAKTTKSLESDTGLYSDLGTNFSTMTLEAINISFEPCIAPFSPLFDIEIEGRNGYCRCINKLHFNKICDSGSPCTNRYGKSGFTVYNYRGVYLCGLRSQYSFDELSVAINGKCPDNYRICGKNTSVELCYPASAPCPINDIIISNEERPDLGLHGYSRAQVYNGIITHSDQTITIPKNSNFQHQSDNFIIYYTNTRIDKSLVIDFRLGHGSICANPEEEKAPIKQHELLLKQYLSECETPIGGYKENPHFKHLDSINKKTLWKDNNVLTKLKIPEFDINSIDYDLDLFYRSYVHFESKCVDKVNEKDDSELTKSSLMNKLATNTKSFMWGFLIALICLSSIYPVFFIVWAIEAIVDEIKEKTRKRYIFIGSLSLIVILILVSILFSHNIPAYSLIKTLQEEECGDSIVTALTSGKSTNIERNFNYYLIIICLNVAGIIVSLILFFIRPPKKSSKNENAELPDHFSKNSEELNSLKNVKSNISANPDKNDEPNSPANLSSNYEPNAPVKSTYNNGQIPINPQVNYESNNLNYPPNGYGQNPINPQVNYGPDNLNYPSKDDYTMKHPLGYNMKQN